ncbi:MAG: hypothetical protein Q7S52_04875 [bacterium]|nr:hypothetical protein [bacterium]
MGYSKKHNVLSALILTVFAAVIGLAATGTLSYPYIMIDRQIQLISSCVFGGNSFSATPYGFQFSAPKGFCFVPNRLFPADGSIQVLPRGWYSVINEYARASVFAATRATILLESVTPGRSPSEALDALTRGGFLRNAEVINTVNPHGISIILVKNATGIEGGNARYDWAFALHPNGKIFLSVLSFHPEDPEVFQYVIDSIDTLK